MTKHLEQVREALDQIAREGLSVGQNGAAIAAFAALSAHEEDVRELVDILRGIRVCAQIDGRPEWLTVAEEINKTLSKFQGAKE